MFAQVALPLLTSEVPPVAFIGRGWGIAVREKPAIAIALRVIPGG
jgi:hypothetical protein